MIEKAAIIFACAAVACATWVGFWIIVACIEAIVSAI